MIPGHMSEFSDCTFSTMNDNDLDELFHNWTLTQESQLNTQMRSDIMNDALGSDPGPVYHYGLTRLEIPHSKLLMSNDVPLHYGRVDENAHGYTYSPTTSYSSPSSTDTNHPDGLSLQPFYDYRQLQNHPITPDMSTLILSSPDTNRPLSPLPPRVYKPCVVCSDKSSGYHYNVSSCEGCKGFFRRSVQKNMQYTCHKDGKCEINKVTRNRCQHCRYNKCLETGMSKDAVRSDRKKKREKSQDSSSSSSTSSLSQLTEKLTERDNQLIDMILQAHRGTYPDRDMPDLSSLADNHDGLSFDLHEMIEQEKSSSPRQSVQFTDMILWGRVTELSELGIQRIASFAKRVPGFNEVWQRDRLTLLQAAAFEILILRLCLRYDLDRDLVVFSSGMALDRSQIEYGGFGRITDEFFKLAKLFGEHVDETIVALLAAICLVSSDRSGLQNSRIIDKIQSEISVALEHYISTKYPKTLFYKVLYAMTDLRKISIEGAEQALLKLNSQDNISPLLKDILGRDENVDLCNPDRLLAHMNPPPEIIKKADDQSGS